MIDQTRVHFDSVEGLGDFVELEVSYMYDWKKYIYEFIFIFLQVILKDSQTVEEGQKIAMELMSHMNIEEKDLISVSYVNMFCQNKY